MLNGARRGDSIPGGAGARRRSDPLADSVFILGPFPQLSQTFVYRELEALVRGGHEVEILATRRRRLPAGQPSAALLDLCDRAAYCDVASPGRALRLARRAAGARARAALAAMWRLPHRSAFHRWRVAAAAAIAADVAPMLAARGTRYLHAHFAGFETELAMALSRLLGVPWGATWHAFDIYEDRNALAEKIGEAETIWSCTAANVAHLQAIAPEHAHKVRLAYHGLDLRHFAAPVAPSRPRLVLGVGRLIEKKGFEHLLRAAALLAGRRRPIELRIVGEGERRPALERLRRDLGLSPSVFGGAAGNREVIAAMRAAAVLAAPSVVARSGDVDGIPNVILEAMACGRPIVATRVSGIPEVVLDGETGFLVEPGDEVGLAEAIERILDAPELAERLGAAGRARIERDFDVDRNIRAFVAARMAANRRAEVSRCAASPE